MQVDGAVLLKKMRQDGGARAPLADTSLIAEGLARQTEDRLRPLALSVVKATVEECRVMRLGDAAMEVGTPSMIGTIELEGAEARGFVALDSILTWHLADLSLGGNASETGPVTIRSFTAVDLALGRVHLDAICDAFAASLSAALGRSLPRNLTIGEQRHTMSQIRIAPDYVDVLRIRLLVALGDADRSGSLDLVVPFALLDDVRAAVARDGANEARERPNDLWRAAMRRAAANAPVTLDAVLHRERMSIAAVQALKVGQVISIEGDAPNEIELMLSQPNGTAAVLAFAKLAAYEENKVVRLRIDPDPRVGLHVRRAIASPQLAAPAQPARLMAPSPPEPQPAS